MPKIVRRLTSIILSVLMLISLCSVMLGSFATAVTVNNSAVGATRTYVYNFIDDVTKESCYTPNHNTFSFSVPYSGLTEAMSYVLDNSRVSSNNDLGGMVLYDHSNSKNLLNNQTDGWGHYKVFLKDTDVNLGNNSGWLQLEEDATYEIKATFRKNDVPIDCTFGLGIGLSWISGISANANIATNYPVTCVESKGAYLKGLTGSDTSTYTISATINGSDESIWSKNSDGTFEYATNAGRFVCLIPWVENAKGASACGSVFVEKVEVTVYTDSHFKSAVYDFLHEDEEGNIVSAYSDGLGAGHWLSNYSPENDNIVPTSGATSAVITEGETGLYFGNRSEALFSNDVLANDFTNQTGYGAGFGHYRMIPRDLDAEINDGNGWLKIEEGKKYAIIVKYKAGVNIKSTDSFGLGIGLTWSNSLNGTASPTYNPTVSSIGDIESYGSKVPFDTNWHYVAAIIDSSGTSIGGVDADCNPIYTENSGKYVSLIPECSTSSGDRKFGSVFIKDITVLSMDNDTDRCFKLKQYKDGSYTAEVISVGTQIEQNEYYEEPLSYRAVNGKEYSYVNSKYYQGDVVLPLGAVKYPTITMDRGCGDSLENDVYIPNGNGALGTVSTVNVGGEYGNVTELKTLTWSSGVDLSFRGYKFDKDDIGKKFYVSFDSYVKENNTNKNLDFNVRLSKQEGLLVAGNKVVDSTYKSDCILDKRNNTFGEVGKWTKMGFTFVPGETIIEYPYLVFGTTYGATTVSGTPSATIYFDNVCITEVKQTEEVAMPQDAASDAAYSIRISNNDDGFVSAGLRFRGSVGKTEASLADEIGFVVAYTDLIKNNANWYKFNSNGRLAAGVMRAVTYDKATNRDNIYSETGNTKSYQFIMTGLSTEQGKLYYDLSISAVMYVKTGTSYKYYALSSTTYNDVLGEYRIRDYVEPKKEVNNKINGYDLSDFTIIRPHYNTSYVTQLAMENLVDAIKLKTDVTIEIKDDTKTASADYEIIVGNTNRDGVIKVENLHDYVIKVSGKKVYINGGTAYSTAMAVTKFTEMVESGKIPYGTTRGNFNLEKDKYTSEADLQLVWYDDFYGDTVDTSKWYLADEIYKNSDPFGYTGQFEHQAWRKPENVVIKDGYFHSVITRDETPRLEYNRWGQERWVRGDYYGGTIRTEKSLLMKYGYVETSCILPDGDGFWSALWMSAMASEQIGYTLPEIDINECYGNANNAEANLHCMVVDKEKCAELGWEGTSIGYWLEGGNTARFFSVPEEDEGNLNSAFHTNGVYWTEDYIDFVGDGEVYCHFDLNVEGREIFKHTFTNMQLCLILAASAGFRNCPLYIQNATDEQWENSNVYTADYVHVYQHNDGKSLLTSEPYYNPYTN